MDYRFLIARRYLVSRKQVSLITVITGIAIFEVMLGVAALVIVLSVMNGFYDFVRDLLVSLDPHVRIVSAEERGFAEADALVAEALSIPHVAHASPYVEGKALLVYEGTSEVSKVVIVRGVDPGTLTGVSEVVQRTGFGNFSLERRNGLPGIVLGMNLGQRLALLPGSDAQPGSTVSLLSAPAIEQMLTQAFGVPRLSPFEVRGLYEMQDVYDESHVFVGLEEAQRLFRMGSSVSGIELRLDDIGRAEDVKAALEARLDDRTFSVLTWYDLQASLYSVMQLEKWGAWAILVLIIIVAAFNVVGSLSMVVIEKRRDIGVLQAMGVSRKDIRRIFLFEGLLIGGIGTALGLALGLELALAQKYFELVPLTSADSFLIHAYPVSIQPLDVLLITIVSLGLCLLAALYPAARAASIEPAHAVQLQG